MYLGELQFRQQNNLDPSKFHSFGFYNSRSRSDVRGKSNEFQIRREVYD